MEKLVIIPCGGAKLTESAPAAELYIGSMFADTLRTARTMTSDENIRILSAKHGLVKLDTILEPYDVKMGDNGSIPNHLLALQAHELKKKASPSTYELHLLLPKKYAANMTTALVRLGNNSHYVTVNHFAGCAGIGYQKAALKNIREGANA
jgi:hypothetical protein